MSLACICTGRRQRPARPTATPPTRIRTPTPMHTPTVTVRLRVMAMGHRRRRRLQRSQWPLARWRRRRRRRHRRHSRCCCPPLLALMQRVPRSSAVSVVMCMFHVASYASPALKPFSSPSPFLVCFNLFLLPDTLLLFHYSHTSLFTFLSMYVWENNDHHRIPA